ELHVFRGNCGMLFSYDWVSIPLVYTQVVTLAIYTYFLATVMGRQYLDPEKGYPGHEVDLYIPIFTILQFFFYMGWLKVSFMLVDEMHHKHPRLVKDMYWDELEPQLPYTKSSFMLRTQPHLGSAVNLDIDPEECEFLPMETILEEDNDDNNYNSPPQSPTNELSPAFRSIAGSKINLNGDGDNTSQSGLPFLSNFPGSKLLNMIIGSSTENVPGTPKKEGSIFSGFTLKTPNRRSVTSSIADSLHDQCLDGRRDVGEPLIPTRAGTPIHMEQREDFRHVIVDIPPDSSTPMDSGQVTPATIIEYNRRHDIANHAANVLSQMAHTAVDVPNDQLSPSSPTEEVEQSPFEPNSSQESLGPFMDSNQSTVSSYAELLKHPK
ncbi:Bestrophin-1, partial [Araneus ventricosus]